MRTRPSRTTSSAGAASSSMRMNHWSEISGSMRSPERWENGTLCVYGSVREIRPSSRSASTTASRASSAVIPAKRSPAASVMRPSSPITEISSSPWARPISKSLGSCAGRDLQRAGAELGLHVRVGDDLQPPPDERQERRLPHQARVAVVVGMDRDRRVGEHRLGPDGGDRDGAAAALERVVDPVERVGDLALLDLEVGDRRARARVPVDHVVVAVDQALVVEVDEDLQDRARRSARRA